MALSPGTRLGVYEVTALIGQGGMGEVYQARDTKLGRDVALKVLPDLFADDPERLARFQREARVLASLNHPNIASIYGLEESGDTRALVLELVEGPTLAERIAQGAIPVDEALPIAKQIADALEAAHERGVIHRDLKPANVKVKADGMVKVLDFGLAKALEGDAGSDPSESPTLTAAATRMGVIMGTAAYMSPEQARGKTVDKRADIWAFGVVLFEMLTGRRPFSGEDVTDTIAAVVRADPDWRALPADLSSTLVAFMKRCLHKDAKQRLGDIWDMRLAMEGAFEPLITQSSDGPAVPTVKPPLWRRAFPLAATAAIVGLLAGLAGRVSVPSEPRPVIRSTHLVPEGRVLMPAGTQVIDIAPGGEHFAYSGLDNTATLFLRAMDAVEDRAIPTGGAAILPFFSPDGQSLGYFDPSTNRQLKRIGVNGAPSRTLAAVGDSAGLPYGASWEADGTVLYGLDDEIWRVSENGGEPEHLIVTEAGERAYGPRQLPGGEWVLFTLARTTGPTRWDEADIVVESLASRERRVIWSGGTDARYVPTGHLIYAREDVLYAVPFDLDRLEATGAPVPVVEGVRRPVGLASASGHAAYAISTKGTLVYAPGIAAATESGEVAWIGLEGGQETLDLPPGNYAHPRLSPDGRWLAFERREGGRIDVWVYEVPGTTAMRRLTEGGSNRYPVWSRDSGFVAFQSDREGNSGIFWQQVDGASPAERLTTPEPGSVHVPEAWSRAEDRLAFSVQAGNTTELWMWTLSERASERFGTVESVGFFNTAFSPDGQWVAYTQRGAAGAGVYVASVFAPETRFQVGQTRDATHHPLWAPDGTRLFYFSAATPMAVDVRTDPTVAFGRPSPLTSLPLNVSPQTLLNHDITPDGSRFVTIVPGGVGDDGQQVPDQIITVLNWFEELKRLVPID